MIVKRIWQLSFEWAWAAAILLLPITSLSLLSRLAGNAMVAPASVLPFAFLTIFWFIPYIFKKGTIPREVVPFLLFVSVALVSCSLAFFLNTPSFKGISVFREEIKAILTLSIGAMFYLVTSSWLSTSEEKLILVFKLISISGIIMLSWGILQALYITLFKSEYPIFLQLFQRFMTTRKLFHGRITSFAFEPSWFANQLNLLYIPYWFSATLLGWSTFRLRIWKLRIETVLLILGIAELFLASRIGTLSFVLVLVSVCLYFLTKVSKIFFERLNKRLVGYSELIRRLVYLLIVLIFLVLFVCFFLLGAVTLVYVLSHFDWRLARFFQISSIEKLQYLTSNVYLLSNYLVFAERFSFWTAGWNIFNSHPFFGVGLGNAGFYFPQNMPDYVWGLPAVVDIFYRTTVIPNIKNFWVRLLAETGIVGFSSFLTWIYVVFKSAWFMKTSGSSTFLRMIGLFGLFVLVAFFSEGFSVDTFALPYLWVSLGIVGAAGALLRKPK